MPGPESPPVPSYCGGVFQSSTPQRQRPRPGRRGLRGGGPWVPSPLEFFTTPQISSQEPIGQTGLEDPRVGTHSRTAPSHHQFGTAGGPSQGGPRTLGSPTGHVFPREATVSSSRGEAGVRGGGVPSPCLAVLSLLCSKGAHFLFWESPLNPARAGRATASQVLGAVLSLYHTFWVNYKALISSGDFIVLLGHLPLSKKQ